MPRWPETEPRLTRVSQIRWTDDQWDALKAIAAETGKPVGVLVRNIVGVWLVNREHGPTEEELAEEEALEGYLMTAGARALGLIGDDAQLGRPLAVEQLPPEAVEQLARLIEAGDDEAHA